MRTHSYKAVVFSLTLPSVLLLTMFLFSQRSPLFADWLHSVVGTAVRAVLGIVTSLIPFSLAELTLFLLPLWCFLLIRHLRRLRDRTAELKMFLIRALSALCLVLFLFFTALGVGYRTTPLEQRMELPIGEITVARLTEASRILTEEVNRLAGEVDFEEGGASFSPISFAQLSDSLNRAFGNVGEALPFLSQFPSKPKPLLSSLPFSYTNITGVFSFFTGEANINVNYPDYTIPFTVAHEMAHQRGIAREDEANFVAFLVCTASDHPYIRYSGYLNLLEYVNNALAQADKEAFRNAWESLLPEVQKEIRAYNVFFQKYQGTVIKDIFESLNDTYLKGNGTEGVVSYALVVRLACAYLTPPR